MTKQKIFSILTTLPVVVIGVVIANALTSFKEVDSFGKVVPRGSPYKSKLSFGRKK